MPITKENRSRYPDDWDTRITPAIRARSGGQCECRGECGWHRCATRWPGIQRCPAVQYADHPVTESKVVLTVAHLNHTPEDCRDDNLKALCQGCHLAFDDELHTINRAITREKERSGGTQPLFDVDRRALAGLPPENGGN